MEYQVAIVVYHNGKPAASQPVFCSQDRDAAYDCRDEIQAAVAGICGKGCGEQPEEAA